MYHYLKGESSFWWPYLNVMNPSDLLGKWSQKEKELFKDNSIVLDADVYTEETKIEWEQVNKVLVKYPEEFPGYS